MFRNQKKKVLSQEFFSILTGKNRRCKLGKKEEKKYGRDEKASLSTNNRCGKLLCFVPLPAKSTYCGIIISMSFAVQHDTSFYEHDHQR